MNTGFMRGVVSSGCSNRLIVGISYIGQNSVILLMSHKGYENSYDGIFFESLDYCIINILLMIPSVL